MTRRLPLPAILLFVLSALAARGGAAMGRAPLDERIFAGRAADEPASFLVVLRDEADLSGAASIADRVERIRFVADALRAQAEASQAPLRKRLDQAGVAYRAFFLVNMIEVTARRALALEIAGRPEVASVASNAPVAMRVVPTPAGAPESVLSPDSAATVEPNLARIGAPDVWARGFTGQGIVVAIADTGQAFDHPALAPHYRGGSGGSVSHAYNWHDAVHDAAAGNSCGSSTVVPCDDDGHGTSTAGVAVGDDGAGNQIGVAPGARWIGCRNMDRGVGTPARYAECFQWFLAPTDAAGANPRPDLAPHVISNSWGCPVSEGCTDPNVLAGVVDHVVAAGIFVAVAAGNAGSACETVSDVPAFYASAFTVGATTLTDTIAPFSSRGPATADGSGRLKPDICAPGVAIRTSAMPSGYRAISGTSLSCPHVAGAVALVWSAKPALVGNVAATAALLESTAAPLTSTQDCGAFPGAAVPNAVFGFGRLDVAAAAAPPPPARSAPLLRPGTRPRARLVPDRNPQ